MSTFDSFTKLHTRSCKDCRELSDISKESIKTFLTVAKTANLAFPEVLVQAFSHAVNDVDAEVVQLGAKSIELLSRRLGKDIASFYPIVWVCFLFFVHDLQSQISKYECVIDSLKGALKAVKRLPFRAVDKEIQAKNYLEQVERTYPDKTRNEALHFTASKLANASDAGCSAPDNFVEKMSGYIESVDSEIGVYGYQSFGIRQVKKENQLLEAEAKLSTSQDTSARAPRKQPKPEPTRLEKRKQSPPINSQPKPKATVDSYSSNFKYSSHQYEKELLGSLPENTSILTNAREPDWKKRLDAVETLERFLKKSPPEAVDAELVVRFLDESPSWKEPHPQILSKMFSTVQYLVENSPSFTPACASLTIPALAFGVGDNKVKRAAGECLSSISKKFGNQLVLLHAVEIWKYLKTPKALEESLGWLHQNLKKYGLSGVDTKELFELLKITFTHANGAVHFRQQVIEINPKLKDTLDREFINMWTEVATNS
ncbi:hypothetical protein K493DRAFT_305440 [Basidiobolus meristosporus CBS 931.73]|uniref:TOG domain-containing protein n=1 Tax=Basidiobolus meristosporus CBS 931.73 TaxID=1314790 RepID=A0A1Y1XVP6_9FUNG|nr:hypothetical protein K493DRAFT_305440 [Basidiobolus meristosporus CBS 931.73]|eukprot:ORX89828.1 hypothetical protein K493DRAFT_305440 [Basidiobolus meristosporus CBS 931.73]